MAKLLMVQGTSSSSGKSSLVTALCRILSDEGYSVTPFKAQNMSSNLYITKEGLEMAKAQAIQAVAARTDPSVYMNPILLKPMGDYVSRVVILGKMHGDMHAKEYYKFAVKNGVKYVMRALRKLDKYDIIVIEGAGSPAEINLMEYDIANMKLAEMVNAPVLIVADIDRGGCFASMIGTLELLKRKHRALVKGFIINKFRGDKSILDSAIGSVERMTGKSVRGIIPFVESMFLPNEDSLGLASGIVKDNMINIAIIRYPNASNVSDFDSLLHSSEMLNTCYVTTKTKLRTADLLLLPSSRNLISDLEWLHESGIGERIRTLHSKGIPVIGVCEGFAMMADKITLNSKKMEGMGLLDTSIHADRNVTGWINARLYNNNSHGMVEGYLNKSYRAVNGRNAVPLLQVTGLNSRKSRFAEGSASRNGLAMGCCVYGLFDTPHFRNSVIELLSRKKGIDVNTHELNATEFWDGQIQKFSSIVRKNIDMHAIRRIVGLA
jgi:adenosylcobyric acid synthase